MYTSITLLICYDGYTGLPDGTLTAVEPNPAVSTSLLMEIQMWKEEGVSESLVLIRLRERCVPTGYSYTYWAPGCVHVC